MLTNEDYSSTNIKQVSTEVIKREMEVLADINLETAEKGLQAEQEENMGLAFAYAADMGVHKIKYAILEEELQSREFADKFAQGEVDIAALLGSLFK